MTAQPPRKVELTRDTAETKIALTLNLDGSGESQIATGVPFFDHMLQQMARHGRLDMALQASGDLEVDDHHTVEDVGLILGQALRKAIGATQDLVRYSDATVPLDEALSRVVVDFSGRPGLFWSVSFTESHIKDFSLDLVREFFIALANQAQITLHVDNIKGRNAHHQAETLFKAAGRALHQASRRDPALKGATASTKGTLLDT